MGRLRTFAAKFNSSFSFLSASASAASSASASLAAAAASLLSSSASCSGSACGTSESRDSPSCEKTSVVGAEMPLVSVLEDAALAPRTASVCIEVNDQILTAPGWPEATTPPDGCIVIEETFAVWPAYKRVAE